MMAWDEAKLAHPAEPSEIDVLRVPFLFRAKEAHHDLAGPPGALLQGLEPVLYGLPVIGVDSLDKGGQPSLAISPHSLIGNLSALHSCRPHFSRGFGTDKPRLIQASGRGDKRDQWSRQTAWARRACRCRPKHADIKTEFPIEDAVANLSA